MMFFEGSIDQGKQFVAADDSFTLITEGSISELEADQDVILGLRPSDVVLAPPDEGQIQGEVYSVQNQFDSQLVTIQANGHLIDVITPVKTSISESDKAGVSIAPEICYYFDKETHKAL